jgi:hypothetical protein
MIKLLEVIDKSRSQNIEARENLLFFTQQTKPLYRTNWHHAELGKRLDRVARGQCRRLMVFLPPQHGKSELVSRRFPAFMLGRNPGLRLIGCSHIRRLSQYVINRELRFKADSPGCRLLVDQLMDFPLADHDDGPDALEMCTRMERP